jgi:TIR domain
VPVPHQHNAYLALEFDQYEAIILDVRGTDLPDWVFPYAHGRLVPTIKLARLEPGEALGKIVMPPIVEGLRMDPAEPGVESVLYWRDADDLILQLERAFLKLDEGQTEFKKDDEALFYFESIGRRPANIFISNAGNENPLAEQLSKALRLRNIKQFHYKDPKYEDPNVLQTDSKWPDKIRSEVETCDVFVAIIGKGYEKRPWCREELRIARARDSQIVMLAYEVDRTDLSFLKEHDLQDRQVTSLPADQDAALRRILYDIQQALTDGGRGHNATVRRTTMLGGSREAIVDTIRHLSGSSWPKLLARLSDDGIAISLAGKDKGPLRSRAVAEQLFEDAVRADTDPDNQNTLATLVQALAKLAPASHRKLIQHVERGIASRGAT